MCGHVGMAGKLETKDEATLKRLLLLDFFRGPDSTGLAAINVAGTEARVAKLASHPLDLFDSSKFKELLSAYKTSAWIGHNRAATRGAVNGNNAHPFIFGHIVGAHNGTLDAASFKALEDKIGSKFDVDSQAIFACIEKFGIDETVPLLQGAWALVWYDLKEGTLNFLRNKERPFWTAMTADYEKLLWASEWPFIKAAIELSADPQGYSLNKKETYSYFETTADTLYTYYLEEFRKTGVNKEEPKPAERVLKGKEPIKVVTNHGYTPPFAQGHRHHGHNSTGTVVGGSTTLTTNRGHTGGDSEEQVTFYGHGQDPWAGAVSVEQFEKIVQYGCAWCGEDIDFCDVGTTLLLKEDIALCPKCSPQGTTNSNRVYTTSLVPFRTLKEKQRSMAASH